MKSQCRILYYVQQHNQQCSYRRLVKTCKGLNSCKYYQIYNSPNFANDVPWTYICKLTLKFVLPVYDIVCLDVIIPFRSLDRKLAS